MRFGKKKQTPARGSVVAIPLPDGGFGFGRMLSESYVQLRAVYADRSDMSPEVVVNSPIVATVFVNSDQTNEWTEIGAIEPTLEELTQRLEYQHQDVLSGQMFIRWKTIQPPDWGEEPSTWDQCGHLEPHVVWFARSHASRLSDLRAGRDPEVLRHQAVDPDAARSFEAGAPCMPRKPHDLFGWTLDEEPPRSDRHGTTDAEVTQGPPFARIILDDDGHFLTMACGDLPADATIVERSHEPNGYFWEGALTFSEPNLVKRLELESEAGAFFAKGSKSALKNAQSVLDRLAGDPAAIAELIDRANAAGFDFDD